MKLKFQKDRLNLLNMWRKIAKDEKTNLFIQYEKLEKNKQFSQY